jgi:hypothetical protein
VLLPVVIVSVEEPLAVIDPGANAPVAPAGKALTLKATVPLKPACDETFTV